MSETKLPVTTSLNGWWDIHPCYEPAAAYEVPQDGWLKGQYLVPSFWTKPRSAVRRSGETHYQVERDPAIFDAEDAEFLFDAFGYPAAWSKTRSAWVRRTLTIDEVDPALRHILIFDAVMPKAHLFVNGHKVVLHIQPTLPLEADVTPWLRSGENEIAVLIEDYDRDERGRAEVPTGNTIPCDHSGIWQDVRLVTRAAVYVSDMVIRTSTREKTLTVRFEVTNASQRPRTISLAPDVRDWVKNGNPSTANTVLAIPTLEVSIAPGDTTTTEVTIGWDDAEWWYPETPKLYWLRTLVLDGETPLEAVVERFGFREVWIEGPHIMLNDHPMHLFSDWGHKWTPYYTTEGWIRQWFGMIRDANMNHSRLHTHPHPPITLDLADEMGILITGEAGLHGSGGAQAASSPTYWEAAADHVRRFIRRDKNHPSLVLWSVENEMRWNTKRDVGHVEANMIQAELPKLRTIFEELDPTRPAYHEGDSSLWNERTQPIISRHYGKECAGIGWWDQDRPLHSGEMALYHYAGPNNTLHLGGDTVFADFRAIDEAAAQDAALIIETGRTLGVSCWGPWNLSCLENLRPTTEEVTLAYDDVTTPGVKPLRVPAHSSEFTFWDNGKGYTPNASFAIQAHAFRPLAIIDRSLRKAAFAGQSWQRELFVVNDTRETVTGKLRITLGQDTTLVGSATFLVTLARGRTASCTVVFDLPANLTPGTYTYAATFRAGEDILDTWQRDITIAQRQTATPAQRPLLPELAGQTVAVFGPGVLREVLETLTDKVRYVDDLDAASLAGSELLIMEPNTVTPGSQQHRQVQAFAQAGGRAIILAQTTSLFPDVALEDKPVLKVFVRAYNQPVVAGLTEDDLFAWGDAPYPLLAGDAYVARKLYRKDDGRRMLPLLDSGEGGFGTGDLDGTALFEAPEGDGLILACQLRLVEKLTQIPVAEDLLLRLLRRAATYTVPTEPLMIRVPGDTADGLASLVAQAREGACILVDAATPDALTAWSEALSVTLTPVEDDETYQAVRVTNDPLLNGVSNEDTCGIETFSYTPSTARNTRIGSTFLAPVPGLEPLLETATESCLRELMVYEGRAEALRAHTLSRFLGDEKRAPAIVLGRVKAGKGMVLFNQFEPDRTADRPRLHRLAYRLRANLGQRYAGSLLEGESVPAGTAAGPGYAQDLYVYNGPLDETLGRQMQECCRPSLERMVATPILALGKWAEMTAEDGVWRAEGLDLTQTTRLYHTLWSPSPRKNIETNLDVPNPEALTFLDLEGNGTVTVMVNGHSYEAIVLGSGPVTISDIALEMGGNHVLVKWAPQDGDATLTMRWRNIMRQPEVGFVFGSGGSGD